MKTLVFGKTGQVARELARAMPEAVFLGRNEADLARPAACAARVADVRPDVVINAAAFTDVDGAETQAPLAGIVNGVAPGMIARQCAALGAVFLHLSTDYVFDGSGDAAWKPDDTPCPVNAYGSSKLAGETALRASGATHAILRTSWVFSAHGGNFLKTMLRLSQERESLAIVSDQIGGPTPAAAIAGALARMAPLLRDDESLSGTYHFSGAPDVSWAGFAREIFRQAGRDMQVADIATPDYPRPAKRPLNSRLDCQSTCTAFGLAQPDWRDGVRDVLHELGVTS